MGKSVFIAEKPSVAREFAKALKEPMKKHDGYMESGHFVVTWCVGHLVTMSYPEKYDEKYKKWRLDTLPFLPKEFKYEVIQSAAKQFDTVSGLLHREDISVIYVCTDSGREGEYIYRLVEQMAGVSGKERKRVWIDSQTEEEILRGIKEAKDLSEYDALSEAAYLRAKEDYLMGINFSRLLSLKYGNALANAMNEKYCSISVGRVMTCVLGMVVTREREIRNFKKTPFYRIMADVNLSAGNLSMEWKVTETSAYYQSLKLYKENGFKEKEDAASFIQDMTKEKEGIISKIEKKKEKKNPPLLYNLAELQNDCSKFFKISPDETLAIVQELYEKKLVTYPRTDARVLSTAVAKEITKNIKGLLAIPGMRPFVQEILDKKSYEGLAKTRYVNDKQITDHYAIIPTGSGIGGLQKMNTTAVRVYEIIVRRFLAIFYPAAEYVKCNLCVKHMQESFFATDKYLVKEGYLQVMDYSFKKNKAQTEDEKETEEEYTNMAGILSNIKKGDTVLMEGYEIKEGETSPPKRYNSGSIILAMENAGQLIEDEELRAQIKGSGIGTSATRAEILKKLVHIKYLSLNKKTQIITPTLRGEMIHDIVANSISSLLNPKLTASWEKGLTFVAQGSITGEEYMDKLTEFISNKTTRVLQMNNQYSLQSHFMYVQQFYQK